MHKQIELLEMQVEAALIEQSAGAHAHKAGTFQAELHSWRRLFGPKLRPRTFIGVFMMFFQRKYQSPHSLFYSDVR